MNFARSLLSAIALIVIACASATPARAVNPGDILVTDAWYGLLFAEQANGNLHRFGSSAPVADGLNGVVSDESGNIYALLAYAGVVYWVSAETGAYTPVSSGGYLAYPRAICRLPGGDLLVANDGPSSGVVRIVPGTGAQTLVFSGSATAVTASASGEVHITIMDPNRVVEPAARLYALDPTTGDTTRISNTYFHSICNLATEANGNLIITQPDYGSVQRVYPLAGGSVESLSSGGQLVEPRGVAIEADGTIVVTDTHAPPGCNSSGPPNGCEGLLFRIHPVTGAQTLFASGYVWYRLGGIGIYLGPAVITPVRGVTWGQLKSRYR